MQVGIDVTCMHTNFGGHDLSGFGDTTTLKNGQISLSGHGLYSPWSSKNLINRNRLKKFMQVGIDEMCMCTKFGGRGLCFWRFWSFFLVNFCLENKRDDFIDYYFCIRVQLLLVVIIMM